MIREIVATANISVLAALALFSFALVRRSRSAFLDLGVLFALSLALNYPVRILFLLFFSELAAPSYPELLDETKLLPITGVSALGLCVFMATYWGLRRAGREQPVPDSRFTDRDFVLLIVVYCLATGAKAVKVVTGNYISFLIGDDLNMSWANALENIHMLGWFVLAGVWLAFFRGEIRSPWRIGIFVAVNLVEMAYQLVQGSKTFLMMPFFVIALAYFAARRRVPYLLAAGAFMWFALVVFPFVGSFRGNVIREGGIPRFEDFSAVDTVRGAARDSQSGDATPLDGALRAMGRFAGADELLKIMSMVPGELPYRAGSDFLAVVLTPVPRALWPGKPIFSVGGEYGAALGSMAAVTPFPVGEAYWNGGFFAVPIGMALWAFVLERLMRAFMKMARDPAWSSFALAIFAAEAYWLTTGETSLPMMVASVFKKAIVYGVIIGGLLVVLRARRRPRNQPRATQPHAPTKGPRARVAL